MSAEQKVSRHGAAGVEQRLTTTRFFRRPEDARVYDGTVRMLVEHYDLVHDTIAHVLSAIVGAHMNAPLRILDVGCGTGEEALRIAERIPGAAITALDMSREMLGVFETKLQSPERAERASRIRLVHADIDDPSLTAERLCAVTDYCGAYDAIVTAFAFHHFDVEALQRLYAKFHRALRPGGIFINADVFDFRWRELSTEALNVGIAFIRRELLAARNLDAVRSLGADPTEVCDAWVEHMAVDNVPVPIEDGKAGVTNGHRALLAASGFGAIECVFRYWQTAIVCARRL